MKHRVVSARQTVKPPAKAPAPVKAKAAPEARRLDVAFGPDGVLRGTFGRQGTSAALHGPALLDEVALVLDGVVQAVVPVATVSSGRRRFAWTAPPHLIFSELDVISLPGGASLLGVPLRLEDAYGLHMTALAAAGLAVRGSFKGAPFLANAIGVELLHGEMPVARGVARREAAAWHFELTLFTLLRPGQQARLIPRIGGRTLAAETVTVTPDILGFAGCLDVATPKLVEGWAIDLAKPRRRVALDILAGTTVVATVVADASRPDIQKGGLGDGRCGFRVELPMAADPAAPLLVAVRLAGRLTGLAGSPALIDPVPDLVGRFDTMHGMSAHGWAMDRAHPGRRLAVEAFGATGEILGTATANVFRGDLLGAGMADGLCAFSIDLSAHFDRLIGQDVFVRIAGTNLLMAGSPHKILPNQNMQRFLRRRDVFTARPGLLPRLRRALNHRAGTAGITIIMPVFDTPRHWLSEALESVRHQFCDNWELICVNDGSTAPHVGELLASYAAHDRRVRVLTSPQNVGITRAVNFALRAAAHDYVTFLDHDDYLEPDAVWQLLRTARQTGADLIYGDEALTDENLAGILEFRLRPAFSHDYYLSHPYFVHPICVRTDIARRIGGWDESLPISADVDFVLRALEASTRVAHVPAVLYRWRTHATSTGHTRQASVMAATIGALQRHLDRLGTGATVREGPWFNQFRVDWPATDGLILIVIPTKNGHDLLRTAVESIERTAAGANYRLCIIDHESDDPETVAYLRSLAGRKIVMPYTGEFNFSRMNNLAVATHGADAAFVLFLNNDIEATQDGWLQRLASLANRSDVGAVGALLMYVDRRVQHAGVVIGFNDSADHALRLQDVFLDEAGRRNLGYNCSLTSVREFSAVTAACVMMRRAVFQQVHGFEEKFGVGFNDTDLCLRIGRAGYKVLYDGYTILYHYESATRSKTKQVFHPEDTRRMVRRWGKLLAGGDPFYNPHLSLRTQDHVLSEAPGCRIVGTPRSVEWVRPGRPPGG